MSETGSTLVGLRDLYDGRDIHAVTCDRPLMQPGRVIGAASEAVAVVADEHLAGGRSFRRARRHLRMIRRLGPPSGAG